MHHTITSKEKKLFQKLESPKYYLTEFNMIIKYLWYVIVNLQITFEIKKKRFPHVFSKYLA